MNALMPEVTEQGPPQDFQPLSVRMPEPPSSAPDMTPLRVLIADDRPSVRLALRLLLKVEGFHVQVASSPRDVLSAVNRQRFDVILMDLNYTGGTTSGQEGLDLLGKLQGLDQAPPVVVMTAWSSVRLVVEAMRRGAQDFVMKPWNDTELIATLRRYAAEPVRSSQPGRHGQQTNVSKTRDLQTAQTVQGKLLPAEMPRLRTLECAGLCRQAGAVGGDYFDFLDLGGGRLVLVLADISGKGVPAALLMANLQATLRARFGQPVDDLRSLLRAVNRSFYEATAPEHYATLFLAEYDDNARWLRYVNCGHNPATLLRGDGRLERLSSTATVLGLFPVYQCEVSETHLGRGDTLVVYSDGITESRRGDGEEFGEQRLDEQLRAHSTDTISSLAAGLADAVLKFSNNRQEDDLTVVAARGR